MPRTSGIPQAIATVRINPRSCVTSVEPTEGLPLWLEPGVVAKVPPAPVDWLPTPWGPPPLVLAALPPLPPPPAVLIAPEPRRPRASRRVFTIITSTAWREFSKRCRTKLTGSVPWITYKIQGIHINNNHLITRVKQVPLMDTIIMFVMGLRPLYSPRKRSSTQRH